MSEASAPTETDIARGIGILLVLYAHALGQYYLKPPYVLESAFVQWRLANSFAMPFFFFLSGMVSTRLGRKRPKQQASRFLFFVLLAMASHLIGVVAVVIGKVVIAKGFSGSSLGGMLLLPIIQGRNFSIVVVWFLICFAFVQTMAYVCLRYGRAGTIAMVSLALILTVLRFWVPTNYWQYLSWPTGLLFFIFGMAFKGIATRIRVPAFLAGLAAFAFCAVTGPLNHGQWLSIADNPEARNFFVAMVNGRFGFYPLFLITALCGCLGVYFWSLWLKTVWPGAFFAWCGRNSLELLILNGFVLRLYPPGWNHTLPSTQVAIAICLAVAMLQVVLFYLTRHFWHGALGFLLVAAERIVKSTEAWLEAASARRIVSR